MKWLNCSTLLDQCMMFNRRRFDELTPEADLNESGAGVDQKVLLISF